MKFGNWDEKIHEEKEQKMRYGRACSSDKKFVSIDRQNQTGEFVGSEGDLYYVTLNDCSCQDFKKRGKPCKHIYQLAMELGYKKEDAPIENCEQSKLKKWLKTPADKIGFAIMLYGVISIIITQSANNGTSFGQSLLIGGIFVVIGLLVKKFGNKKKKEPVITNSVEIGTSEPDEEPDLTPLPIEVVYFKKDKPSQKQLEYARDLGINVLDSHYFVDVSQMISRYEDRDYKKPPLALAQYALSIGAEITPYVGANAIIGRIQHKLSKHERIAFYAYAVYCSALCKELGNFKDSPYHDKFIEFGFEKSEDERFLKSIEGRPNSDYYKPNRNTVAYAAVVELMKSF